MPPTKRQWAAVTYRRWPEGYIRCDSARIVEHYRAPPPGVVGATFYFPIPRLKKGKRSLSRIRRWINKHTPSQRKVINLWE